MSWIPNINRVFVLIKKIEADDNPLSDSTELFWLFCTGMMSPEQLQERMSWWKDYHAEQLKKGGAFLDQELEVIMTLGFDNPDEAAQVVIDRLDKLADTRRIEYLPDEPDPVLGLYVYLNIEAARLLRLLRAEGYSERTREALNSCLNSFNRCIKATSGFSKSPWSPEYSVALAYVGSFLHITDFLVQKSDGNYEDALKSLFWAFTHNFMASEILPEQRELLNSNTATWMSSIGKARNIWRTAPWMQGLDPQYPVDCFEAIRAKSGHNDLKDITAQCSFFVTVTKNWWPDPDEEQEIEVKDAQGEPWSLPEYWQRALAWAEDQLTPSQFKEILNEREEQAAEKRLRTYFFEERWDSIPERARRSLISADRDWFSDSSIRIEAILNDLKIATEELMLRGLWQPLVLWVEHERNISQEAQEFLTLKNELNTNRWQPDISHFEKTCKMPITRAFLQTKGLTKKEQEWFTHDLPNSLSRLRLVRKRAEHESVDGWTHQGVRQFVAEFVGIGQLGILPELCRILPLQKT